ncbi:hypothetical protein [Pseudogulbenkiania ferrooxidans]|uniref:hypothetical protein n=1 Tax=Pseudogulbenkiania ferrooxidans TaxID=549169 RepID=UPI002570D728|nr:hypothetical protein [Pseudogulbenkiania ferrooxidans]
MRGNAVEREWQGHQAETGPQDTVREYGGGETRVGQERAAEIVLREKVFYVTVFIDTDGIAVNIEAEQAIASVLKDSFWRWSGSARKEVSWRERENGLDRGRGE